MRMLIYGNAGSGKSTLAKAAAREGGVPHLDLDEIAWSAPMVRKALPENVRELQAFVAAHPGWVIEGCYGDLIEAVLPWATELRFLNPGVAACVRNCRARPWEPHKYATPEDQNRMLAPLLAWVAEYETREDEFSLKRHREIFERFEGKKLESGDAPIART